MPVLLEATVGRRRPDRSTPSTWSTGSASAAFGSAVTEEHYSGSTCSRRLRVAAIASKARARSSRIHSGSPAPSPAASGEATLLVYPRLVEVDRLFSEAGGAAQEGGRLLMRRTSGFDLHSVRDYQEGESLRKVHWKTTARRGRLMVKELEDTPHDEVAVLLDADAHTAVADNFDVQVRAAGSILRVHALARQARAAGGDDEPSGVQAGHVVRRRVAAARELLASVEPTGTERVEAFLGRDSSPAAQAAELVVVTAALSPRLADALVERTLAYRPVSLVLVHAGREPLRDPLLLRLSVTGVPLTVLQPGDDLRAKLSALPVRTAAHG